MNTCRICGSINNVSYHAGNKGMLCDFCAKDTPRKVGFERFVEVYFDGEDMTAYPNKSTAKEFYSDYRASTDTLKEYVQSTQIVVL